MARKGQATTSDYLPFEELKKLFDGLHKDKLYKWEAYCKVSYCTAVPDIRCSHNNVERHTPPKRIDKNGTENKEKSPDYVQSGNY